MNASSLLIRNIRLTSENGVSHITADVDGLPVWYESSDVEMQRRGEIFACAFLLPAMKRGTDLRIEGISISPLWLANAKLLMKIFSEWWGYTPIEISCDSAGPAVETIAASHTGLFFTGGVDSFYSLLFPKEQIDALVYVHGFDVGVNDQKRFEDTRQHLAQVATDTGLRLILLKTNLREHPLIREMEWTKAHGGALASAGYTLPGIGRMIISSSDSGRLIVPMGTHPETDPLWSNDQLVLMHQGTEASRRVKVKAIADHPLVMRHLRVCWKNAGRTNNCCRCEKCVRTMLILDSQGKLTSFEAFPSRRGLFWRACQISSITPSSMRGYRSRLVTCPRWQTRLAMRIMMTRSWFRNQKKSIFRRKRNNK
ncbi:MAG: hypothetical protein WCP12_17725 [bacterium]